MLFQLENLLEILAGTKPPRRILKPFERLFRWSHLAGKQSTLQLLKVIPFLHSEKLGRENEIQCTFHVNDSHHQLFDMIHGSSNRFLFWSWINHNIFYEFSFDLFGEKSCYVMMGNKVLVAFIWCADEPLPVLVNNVAFFYFLPSLLFQVCFTKYETDWY